MPKLGFTINSKFDPTSIEDYSKMFKSYIDTYKDYEERYQTLIDNASLLEKLNANENDTEAYKRYKEYLNGVEELANNLATNGWDRNKDIAGAMKAKKDYMQIIKPIEEAYNTRDALAKEQREANRNGDLLYDVDFSNVSIDNILANPTMGYKSVSQSEVEKTGKALGAAYSSRMPLTLSAAQRYGSQYLLSSKGATVADTINRDLSAMESQLPGIKEVVMQAYDSTGVENSSFNEKQKKQVLDRIVSGVLQGLVKEDSFVANRNWDNTGTPSRRGSDTEDIRIPFILRMPLKNKNNETVYVPYTLDSNGQPIYQFDESTPGHSKEDFLQDVEDKETHEIVKGYKIDDTANHSNIYLDTDSNGIIKVTDDNGLPFRNNTGTFDKTKQEIEPWSGRIYNTENIVENMPDFVEFKGRAKANKDIYTYDVVDNSKYSKGEKGKLVKGYAQIKLTKDNIDPKRKDKTKLTPEVEQEIVDWIRANNLTVNEFNKAYIIYKTGKADCIIVRRDDVKVKRPAYGDGVIQDNYVTMLEEQKINGSNSSEQPGKKNEQGGQTGNGMISVEDASVGVQ